MRLSHNVFPSISSINTLRINGTVRTFINFSEKYHFKIGSRYILNIPNGKGNDGSDNFELIGEVTTNDLRLAKTEGIAILNDFFNKLSIFFNVPIESLCLCDARLERSGEINVATSERSIKVMGAIATDDSNISNFEKIINSDFDKDILSMFKRCRSEDPVTSFWTIYNIMLILVAKDNERKYIDQYLKGNYPDLAIVHNDCKNQDNTILIAIRDSFSHKTTYSGKTLGVRSELTKNLDRFRNIARSTILSKLGIVISTTE